MSEYDSVKLSALSTIQFKLREIKYSIKNHTGEKKGMLYLENPKHLNGIGALIEEKGKDHRLPRKQFKKQKPNKCV